MYKNDIKLVFIPSYIKDEYAWLQYEIMGPANVYQSTQYQKWRENEVYKMVMGKLQWLLAGGVTEHLPADGFYRFL